MCRLGRFRVKKSEEFALRRRGWPEAAAPLGALKGCSPVLLDALSNPRHPLALLLLVLLLLKPLHRLARLRPAVVGVVCSLGVSVSLLNAVYLLLNGCSSESGGCCILSSLYIVLLYRVSCSCIYSVYMDVS